MQIDEPDFEQVMDALNEQDMRAALKDCLPEAVAHVHSLWRELGLRISQYWALDEYLESRWEAYQEALHS